MKIITIPVGPIGTNCYLLCSDEGMCAIFDPGAQADKIIGRVTSENLAVKYILLTHGHYDHIGAVKRLCVEYPEAKLYIGKNDLEMLTDTGKSLARFSKSDEFMIQNGEGVTEGQELKMGSLTIRVMETPGHTKGGVCYLCNKEIFSGDTLFLRECGRCDLYGGDFGVIKTSLKRLAELDGDYRVYPGHGEATSLEYERNHNPYMREALSE